MYAGSSRTSFSVPASLPVVLSGGSRDVLWERALLALPDRLLSALRAGELDDVGVHCEYLTMTTEELYVWLDEKLGGDVRWFLRLCFCRGILGIRSCLLY